MDNYTISYEKESKKRKYDEIDSMKRSVDDDIRNLMIYSVGTQIHFTADIDEYTIEYVIKEITKVITSETKKPRKKNDKLEITYIVHSPGGSVTDILKFVDFIRMVKMKYPYVTFTSIITGCAASAGTIMCVIADKRYITKYAFAMIHELSGGNMGSYSKLMSYSDYVTQLHNTLTNIYLDKCKCDKKELEELLKIDTWFNAEAYLKKGFVDEIK